MHVLIGMTLFTLFTGMTGMIDWDKCLLDKLS